MSRRLSIRIVELHVCVLCIKKPQAFAWGFCFYRTFTLPSELGTKANPLVDDVRIVVDRQSSWSVHTERCWWYWIEVIRSQSHIIDTYNLVSRSEGPRVIESIPELSGALRDECGFVVFDGLGESYERVTINHAGLT
jgi:hypothetical protein